ncbi:MAG: B12-binding domain-containing radical SAM protein [Planctomycetes bacterium]|jgi:radical SAM superfamily enzyme YgiQ (UPF0313 family)|nr:B12-binding domain-containing radical SAM protein [Planctomycetota bacterium]
MSERPSVLVVDLNNFARYPTLAVGYLAAVLRRAGHPVTVFSPLMVGVAGVSREARPGRGSLLMAKWNHRLATSRSAWLRRTRERIASGRRSGIVAHQQQVVTAAVARLEQERPAVVLISSYLMYRDACAAICGAARQRGIPVVIGGPYFVQPEVIDAWITMPGLSALIAGEVELELPAILDTLLAGGDPSRHAGVIVPMPGGRRGTIAPPLRELDAVPFPDYRDFPWSAYPQRIVPVVTGRGCGWGVCTFCSDVTSSAGRTYRSRSSDNVLAEIAAHHRDHGVRQFVFTDLKLNSDVRMWRAIAAGIQGIAPGSSWIAAIHAGPGADEGLSAADLQAAASSGCVRLTTGLESGSQRLLEAMKKGTRLERTSELLRTASRAGISMRCTMIIGHHDERAADVHASAEFLAAHHEAIERVSLNRLQLMTGTALHRAVQRHPDRFAGVRVVGERPDLAQVECADPVMHDRDHRRAVMRLLGEVHRINRRPLSPRARAFEGVM